MAEIRFVKAFRIKDLGLFKAGAVVAVDDAMSVRLVKRGVAETVQDSAADKDEPADDADDAGELADSAADISGEEDKPSEVKPATGKPKPTDSIDDHRAYLKARKIETKGLTRAQMIKIIAGLED